MADLQTEFVMSMALVIAVAAVIIVLFHRFKQPLILGYLLAGIIVGPLVTSSRESVELLARLGIILITFSIGLEFNFKKLRALGITVIAAATLEILLMIGFGFQLGLALGWTSLEATLLGAILSVGSTMMIVRALMESGGFEKERARLVMGLLIVEDFAAVLILASVSGLVSSGGIDPGQLGGLLLKMGVFVAAAFVFGLAVVPRLVDYIGKQRSGELLIVTVLGLCFAMAYFSIAIGFSEAIGAFVMGVLISESRFASDVMRKVEPVRDIFGAIFFITIGILAIGMLMELDILANPSTFIIPVVIITVVFILAKLFSCTLSTFAAGFGARNAIGAGLSMVAIGEFSLMIAAVAATNSNIRPDLYPMIVVVTTITALIVPYSVKSTENIIRTIETKTPRSLVILASYLNLVMRNLRRRSRASRKISNEMRNNISSILVNIVIVISVLVGLGSFIQRAEDYAYLVGGRADLLTLLAVTASIVLIVPAMYNTWVRTIRFVEVSTSEAMLGTRSGEEMGYQATAKALRWTMLGLYLAIGFVIISPIVHSVVQENMVFYILVLGMITAVLVALWNSVQTVNDKMCEVFARTDRSTHESTSSKELAEISEIIAAMEREKD
ncbi:MAG: cation:proton antiporter [Candidatus Thermoplasmatota archaeon]|nr:cation:proton antiporter [Candidatus Thermoplasmatota archaeon]